jgi:hypothetical protein
MSLPKPRAVLQPVPTMARSEVRQSKTTMRLNTVVIFGPGVTDCVWFIQAYHSTPPDRPSLWGVTLPRIILDNSCANGFAHEPGSLLGRASARKGGAGAGVALTPRSVAIGRAATGASGGCRVRILPSDVRPNAREVFGGTEGREPANWPPLRLGIENSRAYRPFPLPLSCGTTTVTWPAVVLFDSSAASVMIGCTEFNS